MGRDRRIVGRIAPSPSGLMHLGNAFSALLAWAFARSENGEFVVRLENLDERCQNPAYVKGVLDDLRWLGIEWDGEPFVQTERVAAYEVALGHIADKAELYPCFCSRADLHAASAPHASDGTPLYAGTCFSMDPDERDALALERRHALRLHVPDETISFVDAIQGPYAQNLASECGDFVLRRSDGVFAYQLVCVVDDALTGCTQVVRGDDLLSSTPRQLFLYEQLGFMPPRFFHHPMLLSPEGRRLSKRDRDLDVGQLRKHHAMPEKLVGRLAFMLGIIEQPEPCRSDELIGEFSWAKLPSHDLVVDGSEFIA